MKTLVLLVLASGCAHHAAQGVLLLRVSPPDARVLLDDRYIGAAAQLSGHPLALDVGTRRIEVEAEGRYAARREVRIEPQGNASLQIDLHVIPEGLHD
ncbi:MAG: PEGA domain-containing protein [Polyangia bacterium]